MPRFTTNELSFEVPDGFVNASIDTFFLGEDAPEMTLTISREPLGDGSLEAQAEERLAALPEVLPKSRILARRRSRVGTLDAYEARLEVQSLRGGFFQRLAFVAYYDTLLLFTGSCHPTGRAKCELEVDRVLDSLRFRKRP